MARDRSTSRRRFLRLCGSLGAALTCRPQALLAEPVAPLQRHHRVLLVDHHGEPIRCEQLGRDREYIFNYPFRATPCFLLDLGRPLGGGTELRTEDGRRYRWRGGVGPGQSVVAFSAICAHKLTHPSPTVSFIGYREQPVGFVNRAQELEQRARVIQCCSERSIYDPAAGAAVVAGPAPQPLAAIELAYQDGALFATGVYGGELFARYFERFGERLMLEHLSDDYAAPVEDRTEVFTAEQYSRKRIACG